MSLKEIYRFLLTLRYDLKELSDYDITSDIPFFRKWSLNEAS
jgi:hypothetical protein